ERVFDPDDEAQVRERSELAAAAARSARTANAQHAAFRKTARTLDEVLAAFVPFTDPRDQLPQLPDDRPILLMPLRLETRFITGGDRAQQLWVRVYPDDCWIDTSDPLPTAAELKDTRAYWAAIWAAAGVEVERRAAWRGLVAGHGAGRAAWLRD